MEPTLHITIHQQQARVPLTVFVVEGEIDAATYISLQDSAAEACRAGTRHLLLDLSGVRHMGSAGLRALHQIDSMLRRESAGEAGDSSGPAPMIGSFKSPYLKLLNPSRSVARTLQLSGFEMIFDIFHDRQAAIDAFQSLAEEK